MGYLMFLAAIVLFFLLLITRTYLQSRREEKEYGDRILYHFGEQPPEKVSAARKQKIADGYKRRNREFYIDDITWKDLQMDEVYDRLAFVETQAGEESLYEILRTPLTDPELLEQRELQIRYFQEHPRERAACQMLFHRLSVKKCSRSLYEQLEQLEKAPEQKAVSDYLAVWLVLFSVIMILWNFPVGICIMVAVCIYNILSYFKRKAEITPYISCFSYLILFVKQAEKFPQLTGPWQEDINKLTNIVNKLQRLKRGAFLLPEGNIRSSSDPFSVLRDYINMLLHMDLLFFNHRKKQILMYKEEAAELIRITGKIEAFIAIVAFRAGNSGNCIPEYQEKGIMAEGLYHPLLKKPVANDMNTTDCVLITGSNASGKSTFLRTAAINVLLAQTVHTCMAKAFAAPCYRLYTSISISDDLLNGESTYVAEIRALKRIIDAAEVKGTPVIAFTDEILRGTNTVERIAAAAQILKYLKEEGVFCFAATHDVELTVLLQKEYHNYHFTEVVENGEVIFPYQLKEGRVRSRNAIRLLAGMGYDKKITETAEKMASDFLEKGVWSC